jgi:drug/metabolite transporter (DMT)-like permease
MDRLYIALAGLSGGLVAALLGWLESGEPFNPRKFGGSVIRALVAGVIFAVGYHIADSLSILDLLYAFLGGAGVDVLGNRIAGKFGNGSFPLSSGKGGYSEPPQSSQEG